MTFHIKLPRGYLVVYEKYHQRSFIHVEDIAYQFVGIKNFDKMALPFIM